MLGRIKINTAFVICSAFIFRLLFINIGFISSFIPNTGSKAVKNQYLADIKKRRKQFDPISNSKTFGYSAVEILEEDSNDEEQFKLNPFPTLFIFHSTIENKINNLLKTITPFNKHFSFSSSNRYVEYQVFLI